MYVRRALLENVLFPDFCTSFILIYVYYTIVVSSLSLSLIKKKRKIILREETEEYNSRNHNQRLIELQSFIQKPDLPFANILCKSNGHGQGIYLYPQGPGGTLRANPLLGSLPSTVQHD